LASHKIYFIRRSFIPLSDIPEEIRKADLTYKERGNHKLALKHKDIILNIIKEDIEQGFRPNFTNSSPWPNQKCFSSSPWMYKTMDNKQFRRKSPKIPHDP
jgi:hypothetical protein